LIILDGGMGYPNILGYITFNPNLPIFNAQPSIKRIVHFAIDRAIREVGAIVDLREG
jgi:CCR4-NOT transcription complex subunit 1